MKTIEEKAKAYTDKVAPLSAYSSGLVLRAYIAGAKEALSSQWHSVADVLPEIDTDVLVFYLDIEMSTYGVAYYDGEDWYTQDGEHIRPTCWMPIPKSPKDESNEQH